MPERLDTRIPEKGFKDPDEALDAFLGWVADSGLTLYRHQEEAILEIFAGNHVVLDAPTGSGKSLVALALHFKTFAALGKTWYTAPIKALVSEKFFALCQIFGAEHVGMLTGDASINRDAPIICCTAEILANLALREGSDAKADSVVMDEFHYYADRDRGVAWQIPLLTLPKTCFLLMSATLGDTSLIREDLELRTGRHVTEVRGVHRPVPLDYSYSKRPIHDCINELVRTGKAPIYVVHFTQAAATEAAGALMSIDWCTKEEKRALVEAVRGFRFHSPFGSTIRRFVLHGVGVHHAGLLPRYRLLVERLAQQGLLKIICGTDTLGVGVNVPIRTVLFTQLCKFDGENVIILKVRDFRQIAGRAGRAGYDTQGYVVVQAPEHVIQNATIDARQMDGKKKKKVVRAQPPTKGYKHWDEVTFQQLTERPPERLESRFSVDHGRLLMLMQHYQEQSGDARDGYEAMLRLVDESHSAAAEKLALKEKTTRLLMDLEVAGVIEDLGDRYQLDPKLQLDFSLNHSLSLFLIDALATLDPDLPEHTLRVVTWVEAILESPRAVLMRQVSRARFELINALKAAGVPFEDREEAVDAVSWPKPDAELIYNFYNAYREHHPWVTEDSIRPKSIVRDMAEKYASFAEYVKELGLERSEGVLLRYLSDAYKTLVQNVPARLSTVELEDLIAWLRALLAVVDASLVTEWEAMLAGKDAVVPAGPIDISSDKKSFYARIRAELHAMVAALARGEWDEVASIVRRGEDDPWGPDEIAAAIQPFFDEFGELRFDHQARLAWHTHIEQTGPHQWRVRQRLLPVVGPDQPHELEEQDEAGTEVGWTLEGAVDLRADTNPDGPLIALLAIEA